MLAASRFHAFLAGGVCVALSLLAGAGSRAQLRKSCAPPTEVAAIVVGVGGIVTATASSGGEVLLTVGSVLCYGDRIVTGDDGRRVPLRARQHHDRRLQQHRDRCCRRRRRRSTR